jgi:DNA-binding winged helix-turn-helix (wHTH) protein
MLLTPQPRLVRFGAFEFDPASGDLWKAGRRIRLQNQPRQILRMLVARHGELVTREELRRELWPDDTFVDFDNGLNVAIRKIRDAVGDLAPSPRFIETERAQGYRFVAPIIEPPAQPNGTNVRSEAGS